MAVREQQKHINNIIFNFLRHSVTRTRWPTLPAHLSVIAPIRADRLLSCDYDYSQQQGPSQKLIQKNYSPFSILTLLFIREVRGIMLVI